MKGSHLEAAFSASAGVLSGCEDSRSDFLAAAGIFWKQIETESLSFISEIGFRAPAVTASCY